MAGMTTHTVFKRDCTQFYLWIVMSNLNTTVMYAHMWSDSIRKQTDRWMIVVPIVCVTFSVWCVHTIEYAKLKDVKEAVVLFWVPFLNSIFRHVKFKCIKSQTQWPRDQSVHLSYELAKNAPLKMSVSSPSLSPTIIAVRWIVKVFSKLSGTFFCSSRVPSPAFVDSVNTNNGCQGF